MKNSKECQSSGFPFSKDKKVVLVMALAVSALCFSRCVREEPPVPSGIFNYLVPTIQTEAVTDWVTKAQINLKTITLPGQPELTEVGLVWSELPNPTLEAHTERIVFPSVVNGAAQPYLLDNLLPVTTYYVRGYGIDKTGETYLGDELNFTTQAYWTQLIDMPGQPRSNAVAFCIGDKGYIGMGYENNKDFWEFDPATGVFTQLQNYQGTYVPSEAVFFSIGGKGYVAIGYPSPTNKQVWQYDTQTDQWTRKKDFEGQGREAATAFVPGNGKAYVGCGHIGTTTFFNDLWEYDPVADSWTSVKPFPGFARNFAVGFSLDGYGYVGLGHGSQGIYKDLYRYDPADDTWLARQSFPGVARFHPSGFSLQGKGYAGLGNQPNKSDFWEYDPAANAWKQVKDFGGGNTSYATGFNIGKHGYIQGGRNGSGTLQKDFWQFLPE